MTARNLRIIQRKGHKSRVIKNVHRLSKADIAMDRHVLRDLQSGEVLRPHHEHETDVGQFARRFDQCRVIARVTADCRNVVACLYGIVRRGNGRRLNTPMQELETFDGKMKCRCIDFSFDLGEHNEASHSRQRKSEHNELQPPRQSNKIEAVGEDGDVHAKQPREQCTPGGQGWPMRNQHRPLVSACESDGLQSRRETPQINKVLQAPSETRLTGNKFPGQVRKVRRDPAPRGAVNLGATNHQFFCHMPAWIRAN